jgi:hypothetical protein
LLAARQESQTTLARWCGHDKSWLNKFLNEGRGLQLVDLDKIAAFFGVEPYQLFQPGIGRLTERRVNPDRRSGRERRVGHTGRLVESLRTEVNKVPRLSSRAGTNPPPEVLAIMAEADRKIADFYDAKNRTRDARGAVPSR